MKQANALLLSILLVAMSLTGCFGDDEDSIITGCTDSDAVNYEPKADESDDSCVMAAAQSELESVAITQMMDLDQRRSNGGSYGIKMVMETDSTFDGDSMNTEVTIIEIFNAEDQSISYTYSYKMNGIY